MKRLLKKRKKVFNNLVNSIYIGDNFKNLYTALQNSLVKSVFHIGPRVESLIPIGATQLLERHHSHQYHFFISMIM
jgi:hypothetical protein